MKRLTLVVLAVAGLAGCDAVPVHDAPYAYGSPAYSAPVVVQPYIGLGFGYYGRGYYGGRGGHRGRYGRW
jgi:hypothetical protein